MVATSLLNEIDKMVWECPKNGREPIDKPIWDMVTFNPPLVATDLRGRHDTSLGSLPPLYSVESAYL